MALEIVTKEDLEDFRVRLLNDLKNIIPKAEKKESKRWLRSHEVRAMLGISSGTLQNLCINDVLHPNKIRGINFFKYEEIEVVLNKS
ncbi:DNA-binding protein [Agriterribacter sp.]|uniref:DNA-binding protein n=1 Tax=Agriterribacter sp. TaxID=2821509 RepID=UPI002BC88292|nr:DNA-binding protein [Agriterribacter sp.]HRO45912.1 DNA-binding protein [Agriterribacter sp.]HRO97261.1 DNA-binding protein [Ferruginibacter sp.]